MIVTITPNLALDVTYEVARLRPGETNRVEAVHARAGGKGVNVARVLRSLGREVLALGFAGGPTGDAVRADLEASGLPHDLVPSAGETRRTVTVVAGDEATMLGEPGPVLAPSEWAALEARVPEADVLVVAGSVPPGVPAEAVADLVARQTARGIPVIVDVPGEALLRAAPYAWAVKPNAEELAEATGVGDPVAGARALDALAVVVSLGEGGLLAVVGETVHRVPPPRRVTGNPTGAGDAVVAALAAGRAAGAEVSWPALLADAAALSAAPVLAPVAGEFDPAAYEEFRRENA
jgi:tagatose 6-phosphate kinase